LSKPVLQAQEMNEHEPTGALTRLDEWVLFSMLLHPAKAAPIFYLLWLRLLAFLLLFDLLKVLVEAF
jgi:hypothetical protein